VIMKEPRSSDTRHSWHCFPLIVLVAVIAYVPTFTGSFILDDRPLIEKNPYVTELHSLRSYLSQEDGITDRGHSESCHTGYYRPLINLTYWIDYRLWGMTASGFRTTNLILHLLCCLALFKFLILLVDNRWAVCGVVAIFALHPVNTESVSWVTSRNNIVVTLFIILSLYWYIITWIKKSTISFVPAACCFACALLSKEFAVMLLPGFFLCHRLLFHGERHYAREASRYVPLVLIVIGYFILRYGVTDSVLTPADLSDFWQRVYFVPYLIAWNLKLILLPWNLHSFHITYPADYLDGRAVSSIALFIALCLFLWYRRRNRLLLFSGLSSLLFMFPVLNVVPTAAISLVAMRWIYLPMAFSSIAAALVLQWGINHRKAFTAAVLCLFVAYCGAYTFVLNQYLWHDEHVFFTREVEQFGNKQLYAGDLAEILYQRARYAEAERYFLIAIESRPHDARSHINYAALLIDDGRHELALSYLEAAKEFAKTVEDRKELLNNMGVALAHSGKKEEAADCLRRALELDPAYAEAHNNYGVVLMYQGRIAAAVGSFQEALKHNRGYAEAANNLKIALSLRHTKEKEDNVQKRLAQ